MKTETLVLLVVVVGAGFMFMQAQQRAAQMQAAQLAAMMQSQQRDTGGFFGSIGRLVDGGAEIFGVELPSISS